MKMKLVVVTIMIVMLMLTGCKKTTGNNADVSGTPQPTAGATATTAPTSEATTTPEPTTAAATPTTAADVVTTASIVDNEEAFLKAISKDGTWIICLTKDLTTDQELLMEGEFKNGKKDEAGNDIIQRKLALYSQDEKRNITARYTLTAPKLTISSPKASIQHGTFKGDLYIASTDFQLVDSTVDGNLYFTSEEAKNTFSSDDNSKVTGKQELVKK
jgi:hypothetical protein